MRTGHGGRARQTCWRKLHAAFHAGGKCMRPTVLAVNARGADWHLAGLARARKGIPSGRQCQSAPRAFTASLVGRMHRPPAWKAAWSVLQHGWHMLALLLVRRTIEQKGNLDVDVLVNPAVPCVLLLSRFRLRLFLRVVVLVVLVVVGVGVGVTVGVAVGVAVGVTVGVTVGVVVVGVVVVVVVVVVLVVLVVVVVVVVGLGVGVLVVVVVVVVVAVVVVGVVVVGLGVGVGVVVLVLVLLLLFMLLLLLLSLFLLWTLLLQAGTKATVIVWTMV